MAELLNPRNQSPEMFIAKVSEILLTASYLWQVPVVH